MPAQVRLSPCDPHPLALNTGARPLCLLTRRQESRARLRATWQPDYQAVPQPPRCHLYNWAELLSLSGPQLRSGGSYSNRQLEVSRPRCSTSSGRGDGLLHPKWGARPVASVWTHLLLLACSKASQSSCYIPHWELPCGKGSQSRN